MEKKKNAVFTGLEGDRVHTVLLALHHERVRLLGEGSSRGGRHFADA